ncbi:hypothetical protein K3W98_14770, partial [Listeria monocytogenes]|nr:hypothetical protein [Listeria monocytogenes]
MTINSDLFLAILALDSYNRGYRQGIAGLSSQSGTSLGNAIIYQDSQSADGSAQAAGFYGIAYTLE